MTPSTSDSKRLINPPGVNMQNPVPQGVMAFVKTTFAAWSGDNCPRLAAALACYAVLSLAPLLVITFKIFTVVLRGGQAQKILTGQLQSLLGSAAQKDLLDSILKASPDHSGVAATAISVMVLLAGASGVFGELQSSMNTIWGVGPKPGGGIRGWLRSRFRSVTVVLGMGFLLLTSFFVSTVLSAATHLISGDGKVLGIVLEIVISTALVGLMLAMIYRWLPDVHMRWSDVWLGAMVTAVLFTAGKWGLMLYFQFGAPTSAFGAFGSLAAVVIWVYYTAQILFFGAEFTKVHAVAQGHTLEPRAHAVPLASPNR